MSKVKKRCSKFKQNKLENPKFLMNLFKVLQAVEFNKIKKFYKVYKFLKSK